MTAETAYIPVNVITGFLGSGKTTLLRQLLSAPGLADTAVLVNEFGEVGLDHHLLQRLDGEIVLLQSGCVCCTIRGDLSLAIRDLYERRERGEIAFRRLVVETTGLADPVPILSTVMAEPVIRHHFRLGNVVTTIDGVNGLLHLARQEELPSRSRSPIASLSPRPTLPTQAISARCAGASPSSTRRLRNWRPRRTPRSIRICC